MARYGGERFFMLTVDTEAGLPLLSRLWRKTAIRQVLVRTTKDAAVRRETYSVRRLWQDPQGPAIRRAWEETLREMHGLIGDCARARVRLGVVVFPFRDQLYDPEGTGVPQQRLARHLGQTRVPFLDLLAPLAHSGIPPNSLFLDADHLTPRGSIAAADHITGFVARVGGWAPGETLLHHAATMASGLHPRAPGACARRLPRSADPLRARRLVPVRLVHDVALPQDGVANLRIRDPESVHPTDRRGHLPARNPAPGGHERGRMASQEVRRAQCRRAWSAQARSGTPTPTPHPEATSVLAVSRLTVRETGAILRLWVDRRVAHRSVDRARQERLGEEQAHGSLRQAR